MVSILIQPTCNPMAQHNSRTPLFQLLKNEWELSFGGSTSFKVFPTATSLKNVANFPLPEDFLQ